MHVNLNTFYFFIFCCNVLNKLLNFLFYLQEEVWGGMKRVWDRIWISLFNFTMYIDQVYSVRTRSRAVDIFNTCTGLIAAMNELHKGVAKQLLFPLLPQFIEAFVQALQIPDGLTSDSGLKKEIIKVSENRKIANDLKTFCLMVCKFIIF